MNLILYMSAIGALEAVIYLWRYRSASRKSHWSSALSSGAVQLIRVLGIGGVAHALDNPDTPTVIYIIAVGSYVIVPTLTTAWLHALLEGQGETEC